MKINFPKEDEAGFTLVELTIATGLTLIVLVIAGGILISGLRTQEVARTVTDAANTAQQIVHSVQTGVKNASAITVTSNATTGTQLLLVRTVSSDPNSTAPSCQAWYYTPSNGGAVYTTKTTPAVAITLPTGGPQGIWTILGTGVSPADPTTGKVFNAPNGGRVELKFDVAAGVHPYVLVNTMTYNSQSTTVSSPCF
jgi:type II secretory pathway pseudopilin PulG